MKLEPAEALASVKHRLQALWDGVSDSVKQPLVAGAIFASGVVVGAVCVSFLRRPEGSSPDERLTDQVVSVALMQQREVEALRDRASRTGVTTTTAYRDVAAALRYALGNLGNHQRIVALGRTVHRMRIRFLQEQEKVARGEASKMLTDELVTLALLQRQELEKELEEVCSVNSRLKQKIAKLENAQFD